MTDANTAPKPAAKHRCTTCNATFRRAEHLKRHSRSHSSERPFVCGTCSKKFARSDILHRHEQSHETTGDRGPFRLATRTFRACQQCASARQRCTGDLPCGRCSKRDLTCSYPEDKKAHQLGPAMDLPTQSTPMSYQSTFNFDQDRLNQYTLSQILPSSQAGSLPVDQNQTGILQANSGQIPGGPEAPLIDNTALRNANAPERHGAAVANWYNPGPYNPNPDGAHGLNQPYADRPYDEFGAELPNLDDWWNPNHWIPLSLYPSPYGPDLEAEFRFESQSTQGSAGPDQSLSIFQSPNFQNSLDQAQDFEDGARRASDTILGSAAFSESPLHARINSVGIPGERINGGGAPSPTHRYKRRKIEPFSVNHPEKEFVGTKFAFPVFEGAVPSSVNRFMTPDVFLELHSNFQRLCLDQGFTSSPFETDFFPSQGTFDKCIELYFEHFHKRFPVIHRATVLEQSHWLLSLAMSTIGASFMDSGTAVGLRGAFQEFLRRSITLHGLVEERSNPEIFIPNAQARLLNLIGLTQSGLEQHRILVPRYHAELARSCLELGLLQSTGFRDPSDPSNLSHDLAKKWHVWIKQESRRRTGYLIWLIDTALAYLANSGPLCSMDDARAPMPSAEELWAAESAASWSLLSSSAEQPSLCQSMETLYLKKQVSPTMSELGHILLVHALYQKTWETGKHLKQPLSNWSPTAKGKAFVATPSKDSFWLPSYPLYANWRNSACDCLDVLHWYASSVVAKAAGLEHNAVLHLHLARIVLLTPFQEIQDLCSSLIGRYGSSNASFYVHDGSYQTQNPAKLPQIRKITWRWLREDQHKARLAMIHAGSVFWHVRRYSSNSFFEPTAVYLASIVLWTYGSYKSAALAQGSGAVESRPDNEAGEAHPGTSDEPDHLASINLGNGLATTYPNAIEASNHSHQTSREAPIEHLSGHQPSPSPSNPSLSATSPGDDPIEHPQFIHLDRPCDDEMVQHWVRNGQKMDGHMSNIGDICVSPHKVLLEGAKLLKARLWKWGISQEYYERLKEMAALRKGS